ncbi:MAG: hypothetical protein WB610_15090 [Rhodomicrobium sp.]
MRHFSHSSILVIGTGFTTLNRVVEGMPGVTAAAFFQKDPQTLVAHPDFGGCEGPTAHYR